MPHRALAIGCLGWGSLVWSPRNLQIRGAWFDDGPLLPIEFARESDDGRITLVICNVDFRVRSCWALLEANDLATAKRQLASREGIRDKNIEKAIGFWERARKTSHGVGAGEIAQWAQTTQLDAVVWTNLESGLKSARGVVPSIEAVLNHLRKLSHAQGTLAEQYIRRAPRQIDTEHRRQIAKELGWLPE
jgi:hypothetical protein